MILTAKATEPGIRPLARAFEGGEGETCAAETKSVNRQAASRRGKAKKEPVKLTGSAFKLLS
jgi:hypothetical protein